MPVLLHALVALVRNLRLIWWLVWDKRLPLGLKVLLLAAMAYLIFPIDLLRDFIPVIGQVDDLMVLVLAIVLLMRLVPKRLVKEHRQDIWGDAEDGAPVIIEGKYRRVDDEK